MNRVIRSKRTQPIEKLWEAVFRRFGLFDGIFLASLNDRKEEVFGEALAKHVEPIEFTKGRLTVKVDNDARRQVIFEMRAVVLQRLNEFSPGAVKKLFFV